MSTTAVIRQPSVAAGPAFNRFIRVAFAALRRRAIAWHQRHEERALARATREALRLLDDRTLHDLALHRSEIDSVGAGLLRDSDRRRV